MDSIFRLRLKRLTLVKRDIKPRFLPGCFVIKDDINLLALIPRSYQLTTDSTSHIVVQITNQVIQQKSSAQFMWSKLIISSLKNLYALAFRHRQSLQYPIPNLSASSLYRTRRLLASPVRASCPAPLL